MNYKQFRNNFKKSIKSEKLTLLWSYALRFPHKAAAANNAGTKIIYSLFMNNDQWQKVSVL